MTWYMGLGTLTSVNQMFHRLVAGRSHQPTNEICVAKHLMFCDLVFRPMCETRVSRCIVEYVRLVCYVLKNDHLVRIQNMLSSEFHEEMIVFPSYRLSRCTQFHSQQLMEFSSFCCQCKVYSRHFSHCIWETILWRQQQPSSRSSHEPVQLTLSPNQLRKQLVHTPILCRPWCL